MSFRVPLESLFEIGIFETLKVSNGKVLSLDKHLERLIASARSASPSFHVISEQVRRELLEAIEKEGVKEATVRFTLIPVGRGKTFSFTLVRPPRKIRSSFIRRGVSIETTATRRNHLPALSGELKVREFQNGLLAVLEGLDRRDIFERIYLDRQGYVCEGTITNLFILKRNELITPPSFLGALSGVTRSLVLELGRKEGLEARERPFTRFELYTAEEVFLTNTSLGILPVTKVDGRSIADGKVGPWTKKLREATHKESVRSDG